MVVEERKHTTDLDHTAYTKRQWREVSPERIEECAQTVRPANHFVLRSGNWHPKEYEGFAVVSLVDSNPINSLLSFQLQEIQNELAANLDSRSYYLLPNKSFHQTLANTLSDSRFKQFLQEPGLEDSFPQMVSDSFKKISLPAGEGLIRMKLIGLSIFNTAIGILGIIESESEYERITSFRSQLYADPQLSEVDVRMTRPFIGHITLAYIEQHQSVQDKTRLAAVINNVNEKLRHGSSYFLISNTELRRYHHLAEFKKETHYPTFSFNG